MRLRHKHYTVEDGIPIPEKDPRILKPSRTIGDSKKNKRSVPLVNLKVGHSIRIKKDKIDNIRKERSRYSALISKHRKKFNWKFIMKSTKLCLTIKRLK